MSSMTGEAGILQAELQGDGCPRPASAAPGAREQRPDGHRNAVKRENTVICLSAPCS